MKKILSLLVLSLIFSAAILAQPGYGHGGYHNGPYGRNRDYGRGYGRGYYDNNLYGGLKFGLTASHVSGASSDLVDANGIKTGINLGAAVGFSISPFAAFESGLYYVEKGGVGNYSGGKITYNLNYLEVPILLKVNIFSGDRAIIQPYAGAYLGLGVGGQIKDYRMQISASSFNDADFKRGDSGIVLGCGVTWSFLYAGISYEYGLADISNSGFGDRHNRALLLSVGFGF